MSVTATTILIAITTAIMTASTTCLTSPSPVFELPEWCECDCVEDEWCVEWEKDVLVCRFNGGMDWPGSGRALSLSLLVSLAL